MLYTTFDNNSQEYGSFERVDKQNAILRSRSQRIVLDKTLAK